MTSSSDLHFIGGLHLILEMILSGFHYNPDCSKFTWEEAAEKLEGYSSSTIQIEIKAIICYLMCSNDWFNSSAPQVLGISVHLPSHYQIK